jgi:hypothetical protein
LFSAAEDFENLSMRFVQASMSLTSRRPVPCHLRFFSEEARAKVAREGSATDGEILDPSEIS